MRLRPIVRRAARGTTALAMIVSSSTASADPRTEPCPPECPAPRVRVGAHAKGRWWPGFAMRALSLRISDERTHIGGDSRTAGSAGVEERALSYLSLGKLNARYTDFLSLGGGDAGVDGGLGVDAAIGYQPLLGEHHGPFVRFGIRAHSLYRGRFHTSLFELPQAQLGYSYIRRTLHLEAGARSGPVLTGRYGVEGGAATDLGGSLEVGGYVAVGVRPLRLDVEASRVRIDPGAEGPVNSIDALLCGAMARPIVCFHGSAVRGDLVGTTGLTRATAAYVGLTVGFGPVEWR